jgi:hypothetical protein
VSSHWWRWAGLCRLASAFPRLLGDELTADDDRPAANGYDNTANQISSGIEGKLLARSGASESFVDGRNDHVQAGGR